MWYKREGWLPGCGGEHESLLLDSKTCACPFCISCPSWKGSKAKEDERIKERGSGRGGGGGKGERGQRK